MKRLVLSLAVLGLFSAALAQAFVWPSSWTSAAPGEANYGGVYRFYGLSDPRTFNPIVSAEIQDFLGIIDDLGSQLLRRGPDSDAWIAYGAESYEVSEGGTVVDVVLREGMKWSDGSDVTVQDYYIRYLIETDPEAGSNSYESWFLNDVLISLEITGERNLRFTFPGPDRQAFPVAALLPLPDAIFGEAYRSGGAAAATALWGTESDPAAVLTTGPFRAVSFSPGERIVFERNPYYGEWNVDEEGNALPYLDGLEVTIVTDQDAALNLYLAGQLDTFNPRNFDDIGVINVAINNGDIDAVVYEDVAPVASSTLITLNWNMASNPQLEAAFRNINFRRGLAHILDRETMIELIYGGSASPMYTGVYLVNNWWINDDVETYPYDPEVALEFFARAGFTRGADGWLVNADGFRPSFTLATNAGNNQREQSVQLFVDSAREVGLDITAAALDFNLLVDQLFSTGDDRPFEAILIGLSGGSRDWPFSDNVYLSTGGLHMYNTSGQAISAQEQLIDQLTKTGRQTLDDEAAREIGFRIQQADAENLGVLWTVSPMAHYSWLNNVHGEHPIEYLNPLLGSRQYSLTFFGD